MLSAVHFGQLGQSANGPITHLSMKKIKEEDI